MTNRWKLVLAAGIAAAGIAAYAAGPFGNPKVIQALNLTPEQQQKLQDMSYQNRKQALDIRHDMALKRLDMEREFDKDNPDAAVLDRLIDEQSALRAKAGKARVQNMLAMKKILTPEQWTKARVLFKEHRAERMGRRGGGNGGSRGGRGQGFGGRDGGRGQDGPGPGSMSGPEKDTP
jgi:Spy/CpxP family protein refolding chaperone